MVNFRTQLERQLGFLQRSCYLFDSGYHDEGIRIATTIRVLLHDTKKSTSLLKHLNSLNIKLYSTMKVEDMSDCVLAIAGLYTIGNSENGAFFTPTCYLYPNHQYEKVDVNTWINQIIIIGSEKASRRDVYLGAANTDGGAHVNKKLNHNYDSLFYKGGLGSYFKVVNGEKTHEPITNLQMVILRQMAHELLISDELINIR